VTDDGWSTLPPLDLRGHEDELARLVSSWPRGRCTVVDPAVLPVPAWAFLAHLCDVHGLLLHGSNDHCIEVFEPRSPNDRSADAFSRRTAVFASSDAIWASFYAVLDREAPGLRFLNAALRFELGSGRLSEPHYFFSVAREAAAQGCWRPGTVYVLPREGFERQPPYTLAGRTVVEPHWAREAPVRPVANVPISPDDFPLLGEVRVHDPAVVDARAARDPDGFPWLHDGEGTCQDADR
jgi:hypothetical protein